MGRIKKSIQAILISLLLVAVQLPANINVIYAENEVASITRTTADNQTTTVKYETLQGAVDAANAGETIVLLTDVALNSTTGTVTINKNLTIDLAGNNITGDEVRVFHITKGNVVLTGSGTVSSTHAVGGALEDSKSVIRIGDNDTVDTPVEASLTVDTGVTVSSNHCYGISLFGSATKESLTVKGKVKVTGNASAIAGNGSTQYRTNETTINIVNGAEITATSDTGIYHPQPGTLNIDGYVEGPTAVEMKSGELNITSNATLKATGSATSQVPNENGPSSSGYAIALVDNSAYDGSVVAKVSGGTVTGPVAKLNDSNTSESGNATVEITGGTFSDTSVNNVLPDYLERKEDGTIGAKEVDITGFTVSNVYSAEYDGQAHPVFTVTIPENWTNTVSYAFKNGDNYETLNYVDTIPTVTAVGEYTVVIKIAKQNYTTKYLEKNVTVGKKTADDIAFNANAEELIDHDSADITLSYKLVDSNNVSNGPTSVVYSISKVAGFDEVSEYASIDANTGLLTVKKGGAIIKVIASVTNDPIYTDRTLEKTVILKQISSLVSFENSDNESMIFGKDTSVTNKANVTNSGDNGSITYSLEDTANNALDPAVYGLSLNIDTNGNAVISVTNINLLSAKLIAAGNRLKFNLVATKTAGTVSYDPGTGSVNEEVFSASRCEKLITITYSELPQNSYTLTAVGGGDLALSTDGWYKKKVSLDAADGYQVSKTLDGTYSDSITFETEGLNESTVYIKNKTDGTIYIPFNVNYKVDTVAPTDVSISYSSSVAQKTLESLTLKFYQAPVTVTFSAKDATSGVKAFEYTYTKQANAVGVAETISDTLTANYDSTTGIYSASVTLPADVATQLRGTVKVVATDKADNSTEVNENSQVVVRDNIAPTMSFSYAFADSTQTQPNIIDGHYYYNGDVKFTVVVTENNFFEENVVVQYRKDGAAAGTPVTVNWVSDGASHTGTFTLSDDGDYYIDIEYKDYSGNLMTGEGVTSGKYTSNVITIDKTAPVVTVTYSNGNNTSIASSDDQKLTVVITERYFEKENVVLKYKNGENYTADKYAKNIKGESVTINDLQDLLRSASWSTSGTTHTAVLESTGNNKVLLDAIYDLSIEYTDKANNIGSDETGAFIVDHTPVDAENIKIIYSTPVLERILNGITFGYYKEKVDVTFTANDYTSGVKSFSYTYTKQSGESDSNLASYSATVDATQDTVDKSKYTATITLPADQADQLRGSLEVKATDNYLNTSNIKTDTNHVIVRDTVAPQVSVEFNTPDRTESDVMYYNGNIVIGITVKEANFYSEDIQIKVSKDGREALNWTLDNLGTEENPITWKYVDGQADTRYARITIPADLDNHSTDMDYVLTINYKDRSGNEYAGYTSKKLVMDTTAPELVATYNSSRVEPDNTTGTLYFNGDMTVTLKVTERNFKADEISVKYTVDGGNETTVSAITWTDDQNDSRNIHTGVFTIPCENNDGDYLIKVNYTDLATNVMTQYTSNTLIIDTVKPTVNVTYSPVRTLNNVMYFNDDMVVTMDFVEHNFKADEVSVKYTVDGGTAQTVTSINWSNDVDSPRDKHQGIFTLPKTTNGDYIITVEYKDLATNQMVSYTSNTLIIDTVKPTITVTYDPSRDVDGTYYFNKDLVVTMDIVEHNFKADEVEVTYKKDNEAAVTVPFSSITWTNDSANSRDKHKGVFTIPCENNDGDYVIRVEYKDLATNQMDTYVSNKLVIDTTKPVITVNYVNDVVQNTLKDSDGNNRKYLNDTQTAIVTIVEHNFDSNEVKFNIKGTNSKNAVTYSEIDSRISDASNRNLVTKSEWASDGDIRTIKITYPGDANYTFDIAYTDLATNAAADYAPDYFTVDKTAPTKDGLKVVGYSPVINEIDSVKYYVEKMKVDIEAYDEVSPINKLIYSYTVSQGASNVNSGLNGQIIGEAELVQNGDGTVSASFYIPKEALNGNNQFNGTVSFYAIDRANNSNEANKYVGTQLLVVDNITPTAEVTYNEPVNKEGDISYYDGDIDVTINIEEANFFDEDVKVTVIHDDASSNPSVSWSDNSADSHTGIFTLSEDGIYYVEIEYTDRSNNEMTAYKSDQMVIDTKLDDPVITVNGADGNGKSYRENAVAQATFEDINYESYELEFTRTYLGVKGENVTSTFKAGENITETGGSVNFKNIDAIAENDGIYTMNITVKDKANHTASSNSTFAVNRYGSIYVYNKALSDLILEGGQYVQSVNEDLEITEYNPNRLLAESIKVEITRDGHLIENPVFTVNPTVNEFVRVGEEGWYEYHYVIDKANFAADGVYKIVISSTDEAGNNPENSMIEGYDILFRVDATAPEITSITGFEESIINATEINAKYTVYDTIGLSRITVRIDGKVVDEITEFADVNNYTGTFEVSESSSKQNIRLIVEDKAGNITDTASEAFESAYVFNHDVTVSTNAFVRFYANKPLFFGTVGGVSTSAIVIGVLLRRRYLLGLRKIKKTK